MRECLFNERRNAHISVPVNPNYLDTPAGYTFDLDILANSTLLARKIGATEPLSHFWPVEVAPGPTVHTDEQLREYVEAEFQSVIHLLGSCSVRLVFGTGIIYLVHIMDAAHPSDVT